MDFSVQNEWVFSAEGVNLVVFKLPKLEVVFSSVFILDFYDMMVH